MHIGALKKWALALTFWVTLHLAPLRAQSLPLGPYGSGSFIFEVDSYGLLSATGTLGDGTLSLSGGGTRMFWYPGKAAFRAGYVSGTQWDDAQIGERSVAFGNSNTASGENSFASGASNTVSGYSSVAFGGDNTVLGFSSAVFGSGNTTTSVASNSIVAGGSNIVSEEDAGAFGYANTVPTFGSFAIGVENIASGAGSLALGLYTTASGYNSTSSGLYTTASAYVSFVIGTYNVGGGSPNSWVATDPLFEIGNGTGTGAHPTSDALIVYKNGNAAFQGSVTVAPTGDIPMYTGE